VGGKALNSKAISGEDFSEGSRARRIAYRKPDGPDRFVRSTSARTGYTGDCKPARRPGDFAGTIYHRHRNFGGDGAMGFEEAGWNPEYSGFDVVGI
jgi:hypothetical protein